MAEAVHKNYEVGDVLYHGEAFVGVLVKSCWDKVCGYCLKEKFNLRRCTGCNIIKYCGKACQMQAWKNHKFECPNLHKLTDYDDPFVHLTGNFVLKLKDRDWNQVVETVMDREVSFNDLSISIPQWVQYLYHPLYTDYFVDRVENYVGENNFPGRAKLLDIAGRLHGNIRTFKCESNEIMCFFLGAAAFKHSCIPNTNSINGIKNPWVLSIRANKKIRKDLDTATIPFGAMLEPDSHDYIEGSKRIFANEKSFCIDCVQPYGSSPLTRIVDIPKSFAVIQTSVNLLQLVSLLTDLNSPINPYIESRIIKLLEMQKGVLADTNLLRIRLKVLKCHLCSVTPDELVSDLMELVEWIKQVWGENYEELIPYYIRLVIATRMLGNFSAAKVYIDELERLERLFGFRGLPEV